MAQFLTSSSSDIFDFLKNRFDLSNTVDVDGNPTTNPAKMAMFTFEFLTQKGSTLGTVVISLLDDAESSKSVKVYYGKDIADAANKEFYDFLEALRKFSKAHMLGFDVRDVNRTRVTSKDILPALTESKFGPLDGSVKTSIQPLENVKIVVKHSDRVDPSKPGARSRRIHRIYLTNGNGERFLMPFKSLKASRAMARHVFNGGTPHDTIGSKIAGIVDELASLSKFVRHAKKVGNLDEVIDPVSNRQAELKHTLGSLITQGGYLKHKDNFGSPEELTEEPLDETLIKRMMVDERIQDSIPYVARAFNSAKSLRQPKEFEEFKKWINRPVGQVDEESEADELDRLYGRDVNDQRIRNKEIESENELKVGDKVEFTTNSSFHGLTGTVNKLWNSKKSGLRMADVQFKSMEYAIPVDSLRKI